MAHTPGPWTVFQGYIVTANADGSVPIGSKIVAPLSDTRTTDGQVFQVSDADARLLAAAPDLLAACSEAYIALPMTEHNKEINAALLAAITKARGAFVS